jgi:hypothetical protein
VIQRALAAAVRRGAVRLGAVLVAALLASCSAAGDAPSPATRGAADWATLVDRTIPDAARASRLKALGARLGSLREAFDRDAAVLDVQAEALDADYDATREQADRLIVQFSARRRAVLTEYRDVVLAMRRETSAAEWRALTN